MNELLITLIPTVSSVFGIVLFLIVSCKRIKNAVGDKDAVIRKLSTELSKREKTEEETITKLKAEIGELKELVSEKSKEIETVESAKEELIATKAEVEKLIDEVNALRRGA